jgi:hypothetical protein
MNIHQLSINYLQSHDRILVRINTTAGDELRLWFTRRLTLGIQPMMQKIVAEWVAVQEAVKSPLTSPMATADAQTQQLLTDFKREQSLRDADFQTPYKNSHTLPLGPEPLLVTDISVTPLENGQLQIAFSENMAQVDGQPHPNPRSFRVALEQKLVHGFIHLLEKAVIASQWASAGVWFASGAEPSLPGEDNSGGSGQRPRYLN